MRFKGLDLNLLFAFDVLLEERSVSRAAMRLHVSQPAVSAALGRLREYFRDQILVVDGKRMIPTPYAQTLHPMVRELLSNAGAIVSTSTAFDPATTQRRFRICASDYLASVLFTKVAPGLRLEAPHIALEFVQNSDEQLRMLDRGELDIIISVEEHVSPEHPAELLFEEHHVVAGWAENPILGKPITLEEFYDSPHIAVQIGRQRPSSFSERELRGMGRERKVELFASSFLFAPEMLAGTNLLLVMGERLARVYADRIAISYSRLPFEFPIMSVMI